MLEIICAADEKREDLDLLFFFFVFVPSSLIGHVHRYEGRGWKSAIGLGM